jgi:hypothetical protein
VPTQPWSERFVLNAGQVGPKRWVCPSGKRAVIKCVSGVNVGTTANNLGVYLNNVALVFALLPAQGGSVATNLMCVVYAGEELEIVGATNQVTAQVSGFLLDDPA